MVGDSRQLLLQRIIELGGLQLVELDALAVLVVELVAALDGLVERVGTVVEELRSVSLGRFRAGRDCLLIVEFGVGVDGKLEKFGCIGESPGEESLGFVDRSGFVHLFAIDALELLF